MSSRKKKTVEVFLGNTNKRDPRFMLRLLRVPQGTLTLRTPYHAPTDEAGMREHWLAVREALDTIGVRLGMRAKICVDRVIEDQALLDKGNQIPPKELRKLVRYKLKTSRAFRKHLHAKRSASLRELLNDRADRFIFDNWRWMMTVKNPRWQKLPGLHAWSPAAAIALMKAEGVLSITSHETYDAKWYKKRRQRIGRTGQRHYPITELPY